jgi:predicted dienelactone hydrolase
MFRRCLAAGVFLAIFLTPGLTDAATLYHVGESTRLFHPHAVRDWRGAATQGLVTRIWYPADASAPETAHDIGVPGHPIFQGHPVAIDAPLSPTRQQYPLLLLSHGTGGSADSLDWLGAALAAQGYIVVGVNHPGNNTLEPLTRAGFMLWWERATDLSEALDGVLADPVLGAHIDQNRIGAMGFSLGGYTVLELAGARTDLQAFADFCHSPAADTVCHPPEMGALKGGADASAALAPETQESLVRSGASYQDKRIKAVFAIAPALGEAFAPASFADITIPLWLVGGTADVTVPPGTNIKRIAGFLPKAGLTMMPGATHYTFLDICVPAVADHLPSLCKDNPGVDRGAVHAQTIALARAFFAKAL